MKKNCNFIFKFLVTIFVMVQLHAEPLANHTEVALFREKEVIEIASKKWELNTQLDVVGALAVLEVELDEGRNVVENSRLVLGMLVGNGYKDGVTTRLQASPSDKIIIERAVKKAAAHVRSPFRIEAGNIWQAAPSSAAQHIDILNRWAAEAIRKDPQFNYEPKRAEPYKSLDQIIIEIGHSLAGNAMVQHAIRLKDNPDFGIMAKQFILCFAKLAAADQAKIVIAYDAAGRGDEVLLDIVIQCTNEVQIREYIQEIAEVQRLAAEHAARRARDAQGELDNYQRIVDGAIARIIGNPAYTAMLNELKAIGSRCLGNLALDQKEHADWVKTLILTFADLDAAGKDVLYAGLGNFVLQNAFGADANDFSVVGRISEDNKLLLAINLYTFLGEELVAGRIVIPPPPIAEPPLVVVPHPIVVLPPVVAADDMPPQVLVPPGGALPPPPPPPVAIQQGPWNFWAGPGRAGKHFVMPVGLNANEQEYVSFFMTRVMPKLAELHTANAINDNLVKCVIRAASMGMTERLIYLEAFEKNLDAVLRGANGDGTLNAPWNGLITPDSVDDDIRIKRRFPAVNAGTPFFRDIGPTHDLVTTFDTLHTEDEARGFVREYNALPAPQRAGKVAELKDRMKATLDQKLLGLPEIIHQTFQFMLDNNCPVLVWVRFIKGFNTNACYDGTYDSIAPTGGAILASGDGADKRSPDKIFAKMLNEIPNNLKVALTDNRIEAFAEAVKAASAGDAENPSAAFFGRETLDRHFGGAANAKIIRDFVGTGPDGSCKLTDAQMLELIYWSSVMPSGDAMPPGGLKGPIARLLMED